jgi:hypothetical protein
MLSDRWPPLPACDVVHVVQHRATEVAEDKPEYCLEYSSGG